jgi:hypothetical protein
MRPALLASVALLAAAAVPAQDPADALEGTWYTAQSSQILLLGPTDSTTAPLAVATLVTLELHVEGTTVTGEERRTLTIPGEELANRKNPMVVTTARTVTGSVEGGTVRLVMTASYGPPLTYEGTFDPAGRRLSLRPLPVAGVRGEAPAEVPAVAYGRPLPKLAEEM